MDTKTDTTPASGITAEAQSPGTLFIVSTPIGNSEDISRRAMKTLGTCDVVVCEEFKNGAKLLKSLNINKELEELNEHNEDTQTYELFKLLKSGKNLALVSDAGTPLFADPGSLLVKAAIKHDVPIEVVPGVSSVMTALVRSGLNLDQFLFAGFLDRNPMERLAQLRQLAKEPRTVVVLDTPYRLTTLLEAASKVLPQRKAYLGLNLTMHFETHHYGTVVEIYDKLKDQRIKAEFVLCIEGCEAKGEFKRYGNNRRQTRDFKPRKKIDYRRQKGKR